MRRYRFLLSICRVVIAFTTLAPAALSQNYDADHLQSLKWRQLNYPESGPAIAATGLASDAKTYFVAAGPGGLWKTTDSGVTWTSIFDGQAVASVSSVAVSDSDPNLLYVGTGNVEDEAAASSSSPGNGVYKSADAGHTWIHLGLDETRYIEKIIVDPRDPNIVFVASLGHIFGPNPDRGVFRSQDGGQTWEKVLYKDEATGALDIASDPQNSKTLFASLCQEIRSPGHFSTMGPGSGFYKSIDGGATWAQLDGHGLPEGLFGRIAMAVSGADSNRVYALIEADKDGGLYRSTDGGDSWQLVNSAVEQSSESTPHIAADPKNADGVYLIGDGIFYSADGGASFTSIQQADQKTKNLWIDPNDPRRLIATTGSGPELSNDGGKSWSDASPLPTMQFNHVAVDTRFPYYVYGALLDGSVLALASDPENGTLGSSAKYQIGAGSSGYLASDRTNSDLLYAGSYAGRLTRYDKRTAQEQDISPWPDASEGATVANLKYRFDASAPLKISAEDPSTLYFAAQVLFKSVNSGMSWDVISPDLTHNNKSKQQEVANSTSDAYDVISSVTESPAQRNLIWAGTDDGLVHITRDGGIHWVSVTPHELPPLGRVNFIEASWHDGGTAYVAVDAHELADLHPYIFRTHKFGTQWKQITNGIPENSFVHVVREDPEHGGLLFAGTESGVYVSFNDGERWRPLGLNMPVVPVHDLIIKGSDLIAATYGRGFWILDDFSALREFDKIPRVAVSYLFKPPPAFRTHEQNSDSTFPASSTSASSGALHGATLHYWLREPLAEGQAISLEILDPSGVAVAAFANSPQASMGDGGQAASTKPHQLTTNVGLNRFSWDMRYQFTPGLAAASRVSGRPLGALALPGEYKVRLTVAGEHHVQPLEIRRDPRSRATDDDLRKQFDLESKIDGLSTKAEQASTEIRDIETRLRALDRSLEQPAAEPAQAPAETPATPAPSMPNVATTDAQRAETSDQPPATAAPETQSNPQPPNHPETNDQQATDQQANGQKSNVETPNNQQPEGQQSAPPANPSQTAAPSDQPASLSPAAPPAQALPTVAEATPTILAGSKQVIEKIRAIEAVLQTRVPPKNSETSPPGLGQRLSYLQEAVDSSDSTPTVQEYQVADELEKIVNSAIQDWQDLQEGDLQDLNEVLTTNGLDAIEVESDRTPIETH